MKIIVNATPVDNGKVIDFTHTTNSIDSEACRSELIALIGLTVMQAVDKARRFEYHTAAPNTFIRVELKHSYTPIDTDGLKQSESEAASILKPIDWWEPE